MLLLLGTECRRGGWAFQGGKYLGYRREEFCFDMLSLRHREDQQRKRYQVDSWKYKTGAKERILEMKKNRIRAASSLNTK